MSPFTTSGTPPSWPSGWSRARRPKTLRAPSLKPSRIATQALSSGAMAAGRWWRGKRRKCPKPPHQNNFQRKFGYERLLREVSLRKKNSARIAASLLLRQWSKRRDRGRRQPRREFLRANQAVPGLKMFLRATSPRSHEIIIERPASASAQQRYQSRGPFLGNFRTHFHSDSVHDARHQPLDRLLFDEILAQVKSGRARRRHPQLHRVLVRRVLESVNQTQLLQQAHCNRGQDSQIRHHGHPPAQSQSHSFKGRSLHRRTDHTIRMLLQNFRTKVKHIFPFLYRKHVRALHVPQISVRIHANVLVRLPGAGLNRRAQEFRRALRDGFPGHSH